MASMYQPIPAFLSHSRDRVLGLCFPHALCHEVYKSLMVWVVFEIMSSLSQLVEAGQVQKLMQKIIFSLDFVSVVSLISVESCAKISG